MAEDWIEDEQINIVFGSVPSAPVPIVTPCDDCKAERDALAARVAELEAKTDQRAESNYVAGAQAGFSLGLAGNNERFAALLVGHGRAPLTDPYPATR